MDVRQTVERLGINRVPVGTNLHKNSFDTWAKRTNTCMGRLLNNSGCRTNGSRLRKMVSEREVV